MPTEPSDCKTPSAQQHRYTTGCNYTVFRSQCEIARPDLTVLFVFPNLQLTLSSHQMTPTHVEVQQCGGACHRSSQGCVPTKTREREVWVMVGRCGIQTGKCEKECASITVVDHLECGCDCREEERESCPQESHSYNLDTCQCECRDRRAKQACLDQGQSWSESSCQCQCRQPPSLCSDGLVFSNVTCTCLPRLTSTRSTSESGDTREPRGSVNTDKFFSWQLIIILVLLVLIFILLVTIFSLISKLQSARRRIKAARAAAQNNQDLVYTERARPAGTSKELIVRTSKGDKAYSEVYCESPSSGFGSEGSKYSNTDLHVDNSGREFSSFRNIDIVSWVELSRVE